MVSWRSLLGERLFGVAAAAVVLAVAGWGAVGALASSGTATGSVTVTTNGLTATLSGTWSWPDMKAPCGPGTMADRAVGWAVQWGDGFTGNRVLAKGSKPAAAYYDVGTASDNIVHRSSANGGLGDCGTTASGPAHGTWGPIMHTYAQPGTYTACVVIYDVHYRKTDSGQIAPTDSKQLVAGSNATPYRPGDHNSDNSAENNTSAGTQCLKTVSFTVQAVDLAITKVDNAGGSSITNTQGTAVPGNPITYTVTVTNNGPSGAVGASVSDSLPPALTGVSWTSSRTGSASVTSGATGSGNSLAATVDIAAGAGNSVVFTVAGTIEPTATGTLTNTATVTAPAGISDTNTANNTAADRDSLTPQADLSITKTDGTATETPGATTTYTITVSNNGPSAVTGAQASDVLPADTTFVSATSGATYDAGANTVSFTTGTLAPGDSTGFRLTLAISSSATGNLVNTATVAPPAGTTDPNPSNNSATDTDTPAPVADLSITKTDGTATETPGANTTYTITVSNNGPSAVTGAEASDVLPADTTFVSATGGATYDAGTNTVAFTTGTLAAGDSSGFELTLAINSSATGNLVNAATVTPPPGNTDPNPSNNSATDTDSLTSSVDVSITKVDDRGGSSITPSTGSYIAGGSITYTIVVSNNGPSTATNIGVSDPVPSGLDSFVWSGNGHTNVSGAISDTIASLALGADVTYTAKATISSATTGTLTNTATLSAAHNSNPNATDTDTLLGPAATGAQTRGFWINHNGQAIILGDRSTNGVCNLATWLRNYAPFQDLSATASCTDVANYVLTAAANIGLPATLKTQMLATALNVYFSDTALSGNPLLAPASIGGVSIDLNALVDWRPAFSGTSSMTVMQMLLFAAGQSNVGGSSWYGGSPTSQSLAEDAFAAINSQSAFPA
jgi:uncharacterized repeat protein (TIGR01451 family)